MIGAVCSLASFRSRAPPTVQRQKSQTTNGPRPLPGSLSVHFVVAELQVGGVGALGPLIRSEKEQLKASKPQLPPGLGSEILAPFHERFARGPAMYSYISKWEVKAVPTHDGRIRTLYLVYTHALQKSCGCGLPASLCSLFRYFSRTAVYIVRFSPHPAPLPPPPSPFRPTHPSG